MQLYEMQVNKTTVFATAPVRVPKGIMGAVVKLSFSEEWKALNKTVVFRAGTVSRDVLDVQEFAVIPAECTREEGELLQLGIYGVDAEGAVAIPTLWATIGRITEAADPSGDTSAEPTLPVWAQLQEKIRQLEEQGVTQNEVEQAVKDFFGGTLPAGRTTAEGGEIFNFYTDPVYTGDNPPKEYPGNTAAKGSHAEGFGTHADGQYSHAEGWVSTASGGIAHAEGVQTEASGYASHAAGWGTIANCRYQTATGMFNKLDEVKYSDGRGEYAEIVGGGTKDTDRKNIYTLDWDGNGWFAGGVYVGEDNGLNKKLATEDQIPTTAAAVGAAPEGLVSETRYIATGTDEDLMAAINGIYAQMADNTAKYVVVNFGVQHPVIGGASYLVRIYRRGTQYGSIECSTYGNKAYRRCLEAGVWGAWSLAFAPAGLVYESLHIATGTDEDLMAAIDGIYAQMEDKTVRFVVATFDEMHPVLGGGNWLIRIYRGNETNGSIDCSTFTKREHKRYLRMGWWVDWLWVNPPMLPGVEYRTAEQHNGKPVYVKLIDCGAGPNAAEKKVYHYVSQGAFIDFGGYCYNTGAGNLSLSIPWFEHLKISAISDTQIVIDCPAADYRAYKVMVWLKYYKLTD